MSSDFVLEVVVRQLQLVLRYCKRAPKFGTNDANIWKQWQRIKRQGYAILTFRYLLMYSHSFILVLRLGGNFNTVVL